MTKKILRGHQVADLTYYMMPGSEKCMNLSDAGTGKTGSVCVRAYQLSLDGVKTAWAMPKSLLKKNKDELTEDVYWDRLDVANRLADDCKSKIQHIFNDTFGA